MRIQTLTFLKVTGAKSSYKRRFYNIFEGSLLEKILVKKHFFELRAQKKLKVIDLKVVIKESNIHYKKSSLNYNRLKFETVSIFFKMCPKYFGVKL